MDYTSLKDKVPPQNLEAEQAVLGSMILDNQVIDRTIALLRIEDFYRKAHGKIYEAIINVHKRNEAIDLITVCDELRSGKDLDIVGGAAAVAGLTSAVPTSANIDYYARIVKECSVRRSLIAIGAEVTAKSFDISEESRNIIEDTEKQLFALAEHRETRGYHRAKDIVPKALERIEAVFHNKNAYTGVPSGFPELDALTSGFQEADYVIVGARPSMGKTAFALSMAAHTSIHEKIPTGFFTLEMPDTLIMQRLIAMEAQINSHAIRTGLLRPADFASLADAASSIFDAPLLISDWPNMPILDLRAQARQMVREHGVKIIFIDYMGLIMAERQEIPRWEQMSEISRSLKALARELSVPIIALSQVSRDTEGKEPMLSNIRESGAIEQDADMVIFIHRDRQSDKEYSEQQAVVETKLIVAKQRNGPTGTVRVGFHSQYTKFVSMSGSRD